MRSRAMEEEEEEVEEVHRVGTKRKEAVAAAGK